MMRPYYTCSQVYQYVSCYLEQYYNLSVLDPANINLDVSIKALLLDHYHLGYLHMDHLKTLYISHPDLTAKNSLVKHKHKACLLLLHHEIKSYTNSMCLICQLSKAK